MKPKEVYKKLRKLNGDKHQRGVAIEELAELMKELAKFNREKGVNMRVCEEIADVEIVLEQMKIIHDPGDIRVPLFRRFKLERLSVFNVKGGEK